MKDLYKLESFILEKISKTKLPSLTISLIKDDEIIYMRGFGYRDLENFIPADPDTIYGIGSITKSFTALSIMTLVEEGKISLDDYVDKYIPIDLRPGGEKIRIWHLLSHTSGIPALGYAEAYIRSFIGEENVTWLPIASHEDMISFLREADKWAVSPPGRQYYYLNEGYVLLGMIIEKLSGVKYEEYVKKRILEPLEMRRTYFYKNDVDKDPNVATPYVIDRDGNLKRSVFPYGITADGGLLSNVRDLSKYIMMLINRGRSGGKEIVSRESIEEMEKIRIETPGGYFRGEGYGLGLRIISDFFGRKLVGHGGSVHVYNAYLGYIPSERIGVSVLTNAPGYSPTFIGQYALALMLGRDPEKELVYILHERVYEKLVGDYVSYKETMKVKIERRGPLLYITFRGKYVVWDIPLVPEKIGENEYVFYSPSLGAKTPAVFYERDGKIEMIYERYKFVKKI
ncbi:MAG: serine hydrolase [Desulfurococcales archaeon]|nr:serine hydrolase [Desulfurococcales archaeon]MCI4457957.1 serine hydrolase [Desulfurococcaceae archaeon]